MYQNDGMSYDMGFAQRLLGPQGYGNQKTLPQLQELARSLAMQAPPPMGGVQDALRMMGGGLQVQEPMKQPFHTAHPLGLGAGNQFTNTIPQLNAVAGQTRGNVSLGDYLARAGGR